MHLLGERLTVDRSDARCTPHVHRLVSPARSRFFARSLARSPHRGMPADAPARRDVVQRLRNAWNAAALRMRTAYLTRNRRTAGSVMSLDDDLTIVCGDLTETCGSPVSVCLSFSFFSLPFLSLVRSLLVFFFLSFVTETSKFLMRSVRHRSSVALLETPALPYLTRSCCSPTINLVRRIPRYARNSDYLSLYIYLSLTRTLALFLFPIRHDRSNAS